MNLFLTSEGRHPESIKKLFLIKNGDVITVKDGKVEVLGERNVLL